MIFSFCDIFAKILPQYFQDTRTAQYLSLYVDDQRLGLWVIRVGRTYGGSCHFLMGKNPLLSTIMLWHQVFEDTHLVISVQFEDAVCGIFGHLWATPSGSHTDRPELRMF